MIDSKLLEELNMKNGRENIKTQLTYLFETFKHDEVLRSKIMVIDSYIDLLESKLQLVQVKDIR